MKVFILFYFALLILPNIVCGNPGEDVDTHFWLYNKDHTDIDDYEVMHFDGNTVSLDENTRFDAAKQTKFIAHGLIHGGLYGVGHIDHTFNAAYARAGFDYNVIGIHWKGCCDYQAILDLAGNHSARFLKGMVEDYQLQLNDVHAIGFSYGTHVIGNQHTLYFQNSKSNIM